MKSRTYAFTYGMGQILRRALQFDEAQKYMKSGKFGTSLY